MKASAFSYARATSVGNALDLLIAHGENAKVLSGGQSLMPAMNLRLISPELIVDIGALDELRGITVGTNGVHIGALTRHVDLARSPEIAAHAPLLREAIGHVAHPAIRNRGTIGGSLAHADPASELPACMVALDATIVARGREILSRIFKPAGMRYGARHSRPAGG
jgi:aerobic carbon-monoxide dehydrogenase medium subunit